MGEVTSAYLQGIGVNLNSPDVLNQCKWNGKNVISEAFLLKWAWAFQWMQVLWSLVSIAGDQICLNSVFTYKKDGQ